MLYHAPLSFDPAHGQLPGLASDSADQKRLDQALEEASHGEQEAEEIAKAMIEETKQERGWMIDEEMMKVFVNTERWSLGEFALPTTNTSDGRTRLWQYKQPSFAILALCAFSPSPSNAPGRER